MRKRLGFENSYFTPVPSSLRSKVNQRKAVVFGVIGNKEKTELYPSRAKP